MVLNICIGMYFICFTLEVVQFVKEFIMLNQRVVSMEEGAHCRHNLMYINDTFYIKLHKSSNVLCSILYVCNVIFELWAESFIVSRGIKTKYCPSIKVLATTHDFTGACNQCSVFVCRHNEPMQHW